MDLSEPKLKKRSDGSSPAKNPLIGDIENHFKGDRLSFHFGTDSNGDICNYAWTVLVSDKPINEENLEEITSAIVNLFGKKNILNKFTLLEKYGLEYKFIVFFDNYNWQLENNNIFVVSIKKSVFKNVKLYVQKYDQKSFQRYLRTLNGVHLTNKPLIYSTTNFEGYLSDICVPTTSRTDVTLFPGDADLVIYNSKPVKSIALIEFKKHTKWGDGPIEYQSFRKYYYKDRKKYESLAKLSSKLKLDCFFNCIYSTREDELNKIKIEKISSDFNLLNDCVLKFENIEELEEILSNIYTLV